MWGGKGQSIYGGLNQVVKDNYMSDTARYIGLGVGKFGANGSNLESAAVTGNVVARCGGNAYLQQQPALMIGNAGDGHSTGTVKNAYVGGNTISNSLYNAVGISQSEGITFQRNTIASPGLNGIVIDPPFYPAPSGSAFLNANVVTGLGTGKAEFLNNSAGFVAIAPILGSSYTTMSGVQLEGCSEGGQNVSNIESGDWVAYNGVILDGSNIRGPRRHAGCRGHDPDSSGQPDRNPARQLPGRQHRQLADLDQCLLQSDRSHRHPERLSRFHRRWRRLVQSPVAGLLRSCRQPAARHNRRARSGGQRQICLRGKRRRQSTHRQPHFGRPVGNL
jgi:hypothetical protein